LSKELGNAKGGFNSMKKEMPLQCEPKRGLHM
jgi:hypothetical protein